MRIGVFTFKKTYQVGLGCLLECFQCTCLKSYIRLANRGYRSDFANQFHKWYLRDQQVAVFLIVSDFFESPGCRIVNILK